MSTPGTETTSALGDFRARRSVLYMPAANERALEKAKTIPADAIIFDLEDAVAPDAKEAARNVLVTSAATAMAGTGERFCTGWFVAANAGPGPMTWSARCWKS